MVCKGQLLLSDANCNGSFVCFADFLLQPFVVSVCYCNAQAWKPLSSFKTPSTTLRQLIKAKAKKEIKATLINLKSLQIVANKGH